MAGARTGILLGAVLLALVPAPARAQWAVEAFLGSAANAPSTLTIRQAGEPDIRFTAHYATNPFKSSSAPYYGFRVSHWWGRWGGFFDDLHHKLYLTNNPPEVETFEVTYGYNLFSLGAGYRVGHWSFLAGAGPVITNPTSIVRGDYKPHDGGILDTGYYVDGAQVQLGVNRRFRVAGLFFLSADVRGSIGWARVDVANGNADVPNYAVHFLLGAGLGKKREE
ncbi:MAG: hypothetical protein H6Q77_2365 [Gemmatimonadetes bacterium]|jgi:hypothetical protein|nr:hypothetical protein [Gemmatimonadota bacterium]